MGGDQPPEMASEGWLIPVIQLYLCGEKSLQKRLLEFVLDIRTIGFVLRKRLRAIPAPGIASEIPISENSFWHKKRIPERLLETSQSYLWRVEFRHTKSPDPFLAVDIHGIKNWAIRA